MELKFQNNLTLVKSAFNIEIMELLLNKAQAKALSGFCFDLAKALLLVGIGGPVFKPVLFSLTMTVVDVILTLVLLYWGLILLKGVE